MHYFLPQMFPFTSARVTLDCNAIIGSFRAKAPAERRNSRRGCTRAIKTL
jgi:hypothetical protein